MFSVRRRYVIYSILAASFFLIWTHLELARRSRLAAGRLQYAASSNEVDQTPVLPHFDWTSVATHYPIPEASLIALPSARAHQLPKLQYEFEPESPQHAATRKARLAAVKEAFTRGWDAYRKRAWMHDEVLPLTAGFNDKFGGWGATLVDNLDTLWIMGMKSEFRDAVNAVLHIDTSAIKVETINVFETNIRHLGGLLSAYDLSGETALLDKAREFGEMLLKPFDTPHHLPITRWDWFSAARGVPQQGPEQILLAELGSLSVEFTRLSQLTGDPRWFSAVHNISLQFAANLDNTQLPGMFPVTISVKDGLEVSKDNWFTLNSMADSYYEYLPKMHLLLGGTEPVYRELFNAAMETAIEHTIYRPMTRWGADILFSGAVRVMESGIELHPLQQHLGCFTGGMLTIGGKLFNNPGYFIVGDKLTQGCIWSYEAHPLGVMSEEFTVSPCASKIDCRWNEKQWQLDVKNSIKLDNGVTFDQDVDSYIERQHLIPGITSYQDTKYHLRPEAIESVFLLYRMTGDESLQDTAWSMFTSIMNITTTAFANAALADVTLTRQEIDITGIENLQFDSMESFWLAETLKYFYLIFSEPDVISLDEFVFNTEAHPLRRPV